MGTLMEQEGGQLGWGHWDPHQITLVPWGFYLLSPVLLTGIGFDLMWALTDTTDPRTLCVQSMRDG